MWQTHACHDEVFEHVVERCRVAHPLLTYGSDVISVKRLGFERAFARFHPETVALDGVDFAVVAEHAEWLGK